MCPAAMLTGQGTLLSAQAGRSGPGPLSVPQDAPFVSSQLNAFIHLSWNCCILGTSQRALSLRGGASECSGEQERKEAEVKGEDDGMQGSIVVGVHLLQLVIRQRYSIDLFEGFQKFEI